MTQQFLNAKSLKVVCILDPVEIAALAVPEQARVVLKIRAAGRNLTADVSAKALRKALVTIGENGADGVSVRLEGKLAGDSVVEAGLIAQPRVRAAEAAP